MRLPIIPLFILLTIIPMVNSATTILGSGEAGSVNANSCIESAICHAYQTFYVDQYVELESLSIYRLVKDDTNQIDWTIWINKTSSLSDYKGSDNLFVGYKNDTPNVAYSELLLNITNVEMHAGDYGVIHIKIDNQGTPACIGADCTKAYLYYWSEDLYTEGLYNYQGTEYENYDLAFKIKANGSDIGTGGWSGSNELTVIIEDKVIIIEGIPTLKEFFTAIKGGVSIGMAYNPVFWPILKENFMKLIKLTDLNQFPSLLEDFLESFFKYLLRQPATLAPPGMIT